MLVDIWWGARPATDLPNRWYGDPLPWRPLAHNEPRRPGQVTVCYLLVQPGARFSRNARRPSWPSALVRWVAMRCAVSSAESGARASSLAARVASGPAERSSASTRSTARVEVVGDLVHEADAQRDLGREALAGDEVAPRRARADLRERERRDHRRHDPELHLAEGELRAGVGDHDVAARDQAAAAAERVPLHPRDDRRGTAVDRVEHRAQAQRVGDVLVVAQVDR